MAKDYKRAYDNDQGDNTGGMGCYAPHQALDEELKARINQDILPGIMKGFAEEILIIAECCRRAYADERWS